MFGAVTDGLSGFRGIRPGAIFISHLYDPVSRDVFATQLKRAFRHSAGLDKYKSHFFRIGAASHAAEHGYSDAQIRALGRGKSYPQNYFYYTRI